MHVLDWSLLLHADHHHYCRSAMIIIIVSICKVNAAAVATAARLVGHMTTHV
jgi:hypothetical protein